MTDLAHHPHRRKALIALTAVFTFIVLVWLIHWLIWGQFENYTDDAYVNGNVIALMSQVSGTITEINTDDTQFVSVGQPLIKLDPADATIALQRAEANLASTVRQVRQYFEEVEQAESTLILRSADSIKAKFDLNRRVGLLGERAISKEDLQHYMTSAKVAEAQYNFALHHLRASLAIVENSHVYDHPLVQRAKANFRMAYLNKMRTTLLAPATGYVAKRSAQVGQYVAMNTALLAIVPLNEIWVDANYKESQLSNIRIGQRVILYADAYPDVTYHGKVLGFSPGTGASFSLLPAQNATGNWIKIVQRLPVRIGLDPDEVKKNPLFIGLSMRVTIDTYYTDGPRLANMSQTAPVSKTTIYEAQAAGAETLIDSILQSNSPNLFLPSSPLSTGTLS